MTCTETFHTPVPHPSPASCRVQRARAHLREELGRLAQAEPELSWQPGVPPERRSDYWLGIITGSSAWLLWALDAEEVAKNG